ncbi:hypothetical protein SDC9_90704 [bioreactor metagenome]|uniref:Uncharacterized protein n=1 Tax=bioreactor metagenome TaxID=1076179 RepID=A0A644ZTF8_9ZZZZ
MFSAVNDIQRFLMHLPADAILIVSGCCDKKIQRLHSRVTAAFGHDIKEFPVRLGMQLIKYHTVGVKAVFVTNIGRQHLVGAIRFLIDESLGGVKNFDTLIQCRTHPHHIRRHIKNNRRLVPVGSTAVNLGAFLKISAGKQQSNRRRKFTLAHFLWYFHIGGIKLSVAVGLDRSKDVTNNLFLPVDKLKGLTSPRAFGM